MGLEIKAERQQKAKDWHKTSKTLYHMADPSSKYSTTWQYPDASYLLKCDKNFLY